MLAKNARCIHVPPSTSLISTLISVQQHTGRYKIIHLMWRAFPESVPHDGTNVPPCIVTLDYHRQTKLANKMRSFILVVVLSHSCGKYIVIARLTHVLVESPRSARLNPMAMSGVSNPWVHCDQEDKHNVRYRGNPNLSLQRLPFRILND